MGELFEHFKDCDLPAARKKAQEEGFKEGHFKGHAEGRKEGLQEGRKEGRKEGLQEGLQEGRKTGEELLLIKLVCKKLAKNKDVAQIAAELEVNETDVEKICLAAKKFAPKYNPEQIQYALNNTYC